MGFCAGKLEGRIPALLGSGPVEGVLVMTARSKSLVSAITLLDQHRRRWLAARPMPRILTVLRLPTEASVPPALNQANPCRFQPTAAFDYIDDAMLVFVGPVRPDHAEAAIWRRVAAAIEQLTDTTGPLNDNAPI